MDIVEQHIRRLPDEELIRMVRIDFDEYTDEALEYARDEMGKRGIREDAVEEVGSFGCEGGAAQAEPICGETMESFLRDELTYQESCDAIYDFVTSMAIRSGEYEGGKMVIRKMDRDNFILYTEGTNEVAGRVISGCVAVSKDRLEALISEIAEENGFAAEEGEALDQLVGGIEKLRN